MMAERAKARSKRFCSIAYAVLGKKPPDKKLYSTGSYPPG
jgi:hypothetical protein